MDHVDCYLCGSNDFDIVFKGSEGIELRPEHVAARQGSVNKEYCYRWVKCKKCKLVYANPVPSLAELEELYSKSEQGGYDAEEDNLSYTYGRYLKKYSSFIKNKGTAIDVGAGSGFFLKNLLDIGFADVVGFEPSKEACESVSAEVASMLKNEPYRESNLGLNSVDFISCFQTLEHINEPDKLIESFSRVLKKDGLVYCVAHDFGSLGVKLIGEKHPIVNAGHLTLFDQKTISLMFDRFFEVLAVFPVANKYSLNYWLTLVPLPDKIKDIIHNILNKIGLGKLTCSLKMGNMGIVARKRG